MLRTWGQNIAQTRKLRNSDGEILRKGQPVMSQAALGKAVGNVTQSTVSRWEEGKVEPRLGHKLRIAEVLGAAPAALFPMPVTL